MTRLTHGASAWRTRRCRCGVCREANLALTYKNRQERQARLRRDPTLVPHGSISTYQNWMCRCQLCVDANKARCADYYDKWLRKR